MSSLIANLPRLGWQASVHQRLTDVIAMCAARRSERAVAVFDFDNTCILNDIGELFSHYLIEEMHYRYDLDAFWDLIHPEDGRDRIYDLTQQALGLRPQDRVRSDVYREYVAEMGATYGRRLARAGKADCYEWAVRLHVGLTPEQVREYAHHAICRELDRELQTQELATAAGDGGSVECGIRMFQEIRTLMDALRAAGVEVWIVSASNIWAIQVFAPRFGVSREQALGNRLRLGSDGLLSCETLVPVTFRQGKVDLINEVIGCVPVLAAGDADTDFEMLCQASELALVIDRGNELLRAEAATRNWAVQPQSELSCASQE